MNSRHIAQQACVIRLHNPLARWAWPLGGVLVFVAVIALGAWLDEPAEAPELPELAFQRGVAAGRQQMQLAYAERNRIAYQAGRDEAAARCVPQQGARK